MDNLPGSQPPIHIDIGGQGTIFPIVEIQLKKGIKANGEVDEVEH